MSLLHPTEEDDAFARSYTEASLGDATKHLQEWHKHILMTASALRREADLLEALAKEFKP